ncbi:MAG: hypothetical protein HRT61_21430 [Ekhidna sp.]|nr:hypothetical protein [Ekhidna sp.]
MNKTLPSETYGDFTADFQGSADGDTEVICIDGMMVIPTDEGCTYITKEQAKLFFNLEDK